MALTDRQQVAIAVLPKFYTVKTVVEDVFGGDFQAFGDAWVSGDLPATVTTALRDVIIPSLEQTLWLRRIAQQNDTIIQLLKESHGAHDRR